MWVGWESEAAEGHGVWEKTRDRKSTRLNSSHLVISYAVFCLKKKTQSVTSVCPALLPAKSRPPAPWSWLTSEPVSRGPGSISKQAQRIRNLPTAPHSTPATQP